VSLPNGISFRLTALAGFTSVTDDRHIQTDRQTDGWTGHAMLISVIIIIIIIIIIFFNIKLTYATMNTVVKIIECQQMGQSNTQYIHSKAKQAWKHANMF